MLDILRIREYKGCGECELCTNDGCIGIKTPVKVTFLKPQLADDWGHFVTVFEKDEVVKAEARFRDNTIYCISAKSNIYDDYEDFIFTENISVELITPEGEL